MENENLIDIPFVEDAMDEADAAAASDDAALTPQQALAGGLQQEVGHGDQ